MTTAEFADLRRAIEQLRHCVSAVHSAYGDAPGVRRLVNDVERLEIDAADLASAEPVRHGHVPQHVVVPDTPLDESMFEGADDEGLGGYHGDRS